MIINLILFFFNLLVKKSEFQILNLISCCVTDFNFIGLVLLEWHSQA